MQSLLKWIVGATVVGGVLYLATSEESPEESDEETSLKIRKLRGELQREVRKRKAIRKRMETMSSPELSD